MEYYSSVKRNRLLTHATYYLKSNMLSSKSQTQKTAYHIIPHETVEKANHSDRKHISGCQRSRNGTDCKGGQGNFLGIQKGSRS